MPTHTIKAIIVDDERLARNELKKLLVHYFIHLRLIKIKKIERWICANR